MPITLPRLATAALVGGLTLGVAAPAFAQDDATASQDLSQGKARCQEAIDRREADLATAQSRIAAIETLTDANEATLNGIIDGTEAGLAEQSVEIDAADDRAELAELCAQIASDFRVYLVVLPQTHLTVAADRVEAASVRGGDLVARLDDAIAAAAEAGADVSEATALRDQAAAHLDAASASVVGVADSALGVSPTSYNDGDGATVLDSARESVRTGHGEITAAIEDGRAAAEAIRAAIDAVGSDA